MSALKALDLDVLYARSLLMRKRWKLLFALSAGVALIVALAIPAVHWRLIGWARNEPFYRNRPVSFYSKRLTATGDLIRVGGVTVAVTPEYSKVCSPAEALVRNGLGHEIADVFWSLNWQLSEPECIPVLLVLLEDPEPFVRYWAAFRLGEFAEESRVAVEKLREMVSDDTLIKHYGHDHRLGDVAAEALRKIPVDAAAAPNNP